MSLQVAKGTSLIALASEEGQFRLSQVLHGETGDSVSCGQASVINVWCKQRHMTNCGLTSLAIVLNSVGGDVDEDEVLSLVEQGANVPTMGAVQSRGLSLPELEAIALALPGRVNKTCRSHAGVDAAARTLEDFRSSVIEALKGNSATYSGHISTRAILNYSQRDLGSENLGGHFSPLAAYHGPTDTVLICDTWWTTEPMWAPVEKVWMAILGLDTDTNEPRGLLTIECMQRSDRN